MWATVSAPESAPLVVLCAGALVYTGLSVAVVVSHARYRENSKERILGALLKFLVCLVVALFAPLFSPLGAISGVFMAAMAWEMLTKNRHAFDAPPNGSP